MSGSAMTLRKIILVPEHCVVTASGRMTAPHPRYVLDSPRKATNSIKRHQQWLVDEVLAEIDATGARWALPEATQAVPGRLTTAEHLSFYMTLFGKDADVWIQYDGQKDGAE